MECDRTELNLVACRDLHDVIRDPSQELPEAFRNNDAWLPADTPQRRHMQVVVVCVRNENDVDLHIVEEMGDGVRMSMERPQSVDEQGIGENPHTVHLEQDGRVSQVPEPRAHRPSLMRRS